MDKTIIKCFKPILKRVKFVGINIYWLLHNIASRCVKLFITSIYITLYTRCLTYSVKSD